MKKCFKIFQTDSMVEIENKKTKSTYEHAFFVKLLDKEYKTKVDAEHDLNIYLSQHPDEINEYTILEIYTK